MNREVCGICWCPYDEETGECACAPQGDKESAMNREDIIRMAREAGFMQHLGVIAIPNFQNLERFAHLVYEATFRDANIAASRTILDAAVLEEREACAKVCEQWNASHPEALAAAIRARSNP